MTKPLPTCSPEDHASERRSIPFDGKAMELCARIFRAMGDTARLRLITRLSQGAACVGELAKLEGESITTISQRLRVLRADNIVQRKREGKHILYFLADQHMFDLISNGLAHAAETFSSTPTATQP